MARWFSNESRAYLFKLLCVGAVYVSVAYLSLFLVPHGGSGASLVWPTSAVGIAALFLFGSDLWPALVVPFFLLLLGQGVEPPVAAAVAAANALEAFIGAYILRRFGFKPMIDRLPDALVFAVASFVSSFVTAAIIPLALEIFRHESFNTALWGGLWIGHAVSLLSFGPFAIRWVYKPLFTRTPLLWLEGIIVIGGIALTTYLAYWTTYGSIGPVSLLYVSIFLLIWAALRTGPRGITLSLFLMALIASLAVFFGHGPLIADPAKIPQVLLSIQLVVGTLSLIFILFTAILEERKEATKALHGHVGALEQAVEKIREEDKAKNDFIAILAHELRNPLSPILSSLEIMKQRGVKEENMSAVNSIASNINIMARLLDDLLDISRVTQKKFRLQPEPVELSKVVSQAVEIARPFMDSRSHTLTVELPEERLWLSADPIRLVQIFVNLLNNAAKYTEPGGKVRLYAERQGEELVACVEDTGRGIEPGRMRKIFEAFASDGRSSHGGLHIGLSLAQRMTQLHHGTLEAESEGEGRGSRFTVRLPLMPMSPLPGLETPQKRTRFSREALLAAQSGPMSVLVVDDNEAAAKSISTLLEHNGHRPLVAYDGESALALCRGGAAPAAALLDIGLPGMDGYELARRLRQIFGQDIKLIALTGYGQADDKTKARQAGFDAHLTKPVSIIDIERTLAETRNHSRSSV